MRDWQRREGSLLLREPRYRTDALDFYRADLRG
jgi:hypothetical protein